jgi:hypothetical protein
MWQLLLSNLTYIGVAFGVFALCVIANIVVSVYYNTNNLGEVFEGKRLLSGLIKMLSVGITTAILAIVATILPVVIEEFGVDVPSDVQNTYTIVAVVALYIGAILRYYKQAYITTKEILENKNILDDQNNSERRW